MSEDNEVAKMIEKLEAGGNKYISGIYNYCDNWCERCSYTDRCINYSEIMQESNEEDQKISQEELLNKLSKMFNDIISFIKSETEKQGINLEDISEERSEYDNAKEKVHNHILAKKSFQYFQLVHEWFQSRGEIISGKTKEFIRFTELGFDEEKIVENLKDFKNAIEVIQWYFTLIRVKLMRALQTKFYDPIGDPEFNKEQYLVSAKIAYVCCVKSLQAWQLLYDFLTEDQDKILDILAFLDNLIKTIREEFTEVEKFKRPYFD